MSPPNCLPYDSDVIFNGKRRPLLFTVSGGGGHLAAADSIQHYITSQYPETIWADHYPVPKSESDQSAHNHTLTQMNMYIHLLHDYTLSPLFRMLLSYTFLPILPSEKEIIQEETHLLQLNNPSEPRKYVDIQLDSWPGGYRCAAIANVFAKDNNVTEIKKAYSLQSPTEARYDIPVYEFILNKLVTAANQKVPYTEIICTQTLNLKAMANAVIEYNTFLASSTNPDIARYPKIIIHQYMTDLFTKGATHYLNSLNSLEQRQKNQFKLYACNLTEESINKYIKHPADYLSLNNIAYDNNPLVRPGFKRENESLHDKFNQTHLLHYLYRHTNDKASPPKTKKLKSRTVTNSRVLCLVVKQVKKRLSMFNP